MCRRRRSERAAGFETIAPRQRTSAFIIGEIEIVRKLVAAVDMIDVAWAWEMGIPA